MSEKYSHSKQTLQSETSRRIFLKTGAAAAGAALLGAAVKATPTTAADQAQDKQEEVQLLEHLDVKNTPFQFA